MKKSTTTLRKNKYEHGLYKRAVFIFLYEIGKENYYSLSLCIQTEIGRKICRDKG